VTQFAPVDHEAFLVIRTRGVFWTRPFVAALASAVAAVVIGGVVLAVTGFPCPFLPTQVLEGTSGSKGEIFEDGQIRKLLMRRHIRVRNTRVGSVASANGDLAHYHYVFPSGAPAAEVVLKRLIGQSRAPSVSRPFTSPLVFGSFRPYAETLVDKGVATHLTGPYYSVDMVRLWAYLKAGTSWDAMGIGKYGLTNGNRILIQGPSACESNSGEAYLALLAKIANDDVQPTAGAAGRLGDQLRPVVSSVLPEREPDKAYVTPEGQSQAPVVVMYEHQYLAHQLEYEAQYGHADDDRVLLYPTPAVQNDAAFIALRPEAEKLGAYLTNDPALRHREMELGYRVVDPTGRDDSVKLAEFLISHHVPAPPQPPAAVPMPPLAVLEKLQKAVGCEVTRDGHE
jgi:hypothetical protein